MFQEANGAALHDLSRQIAVLFDRLRGRRQGDLTTIQGD
jgi:hypothetical protein